MTKRWSALLLVCWPFIWVCAEALPTHIVEARERLQREQDAIAHIYAEHQHACWQRLVVNACLQEARKNRDAALAPLRAQTLALNAQERLWRSEQRDQRLRDKQARPEHQP